MIEVKQLKRSFKDGDRQIDVLKGIDFRAETGEFISIMGRSGAGKSTLLYQMSLLDYPTSGEIIIDDVATENLHADARTNFRLTHFGYVFQDYALLPELTAIDNVVLPLLMQGVEKKKAYERATETLTIVGLGHRLENIPSKMSGGEQQRVSIARGIVHHPKILFADEPTANLDNESSATVMKLFQQLNKEGQTIIMVTHEPEYAKLADRIVKIDDGRILSIQKNH
ncbi:MAG: ABC transporter ATP-binding protein [Candidatus Uhrbacteria bacterium]|nr:ABC transporter ATP-binding protein [Candidatus Uhrbacteria bacterium]